MSIHDDCEDRIVWRMSPSGVFSISTAYALLSLPETLPYDSWKWFWQSKGPEDIKVLLWLACKRRMHTQKLRLQRGMSTSSQCLLCLDAKEDEVRVLRDCSWAKEI